MLRRLFSGGPLRFSFATNQPTHCRLFSASSNGGPGGIWNSSDDPKAAPSLFADLNEDWPEADEPKGLQFEDRQEEEKEGIKMKEEAVAALDEADLDSKEQQLRHTLKGPNRAFGDLIAASGITQGMLDSLILLKDVTDVPGLSPLQEIEDRAIAKLNATSTRTDIERRKQEQLAQARVKQVDEQGRAYATGKRKCSVARVWIQPGTGKIFVNDKEFDVYFPILDHRADLLQPFTVTHTLGRWDVNCTVKGGGVSGQVGAIRLGISRALEKFEPAYRPYLKAVGYLTRDSRVVERKKPGKAKARKSFQWVKR